MHAAATRFERRGQARAELAEQLIVRAQLFLPCARVDARQLVEARRVDFLQALPVQILMSRHGAERRLHALPAPLATFQDPGEDAHVLAEARPQELAVRIAPEPVDAEDLRQFLYRATHLQPMAEVVAHVVAAER